MLLPTSTTCELPGFPLKAGGRLDPLVQAYETWGELSEAGDNCVLVCHGYTSSPHAAGNEDGWWQGLIGPGCAMDTDRHFVVCSNMIGSSYGSSGPPSIDPVSGRPFGPDFPEFCVADMVEAQKLLLDELGVTRLKCVIGYSYGGYLTFDWGARYPDLMQSLIVVASGIQGRGDQTMLAELEGRFGECSGWNGGRFYGADPAGSVVAKLREMRIETLRSYHTDHYLRDQLGDATAAEARLEELAGTWAEGFDANALIALRRAAMAFDGRADVGAIKAPLLYVLASTDLLFGPELADPTMAMLRDAGVSAEYVEIDSPYGHYAPSVDWAKWAPDLENFLGRFAV
ncbi:MAG: alpha/beta fold hydrolase [Hyphomicrobiaceae bacterium]